MIKLETIEDFRDNRIPTNLLTDEEFAVLTSVPPEDLEYQAGFKYNGIVWERSTTCPKEYQNIIYRYNPANKESESEK